MTTEIVIHNLAEVEIPGLEGFETHIRPHFLVEPKPLKKDGKGKVQKEEPVTLKIKVGREEGIIYTAAIYANLTCLRSNSPTNFANRVIVYNSSDQEVTGQLNFGEATINGEPATKAIIFDAIKKPLISIKKVDPLAAKKLSDSMVPNLTPPAGFSFRGVIKEHTYGSVKKGAKRLKPGRKFRSNLNRLRRMVPGL